MSSFCWVPASHICLPLCSSAAAVRLCGLSYNPLLVATKKKKNPKSHKSIKGNNSKQREGNDPGLLLLKGGEKHVHACSFSSFCPRHTHFPTCRWSCTPGRRRRTGKAESRPILDQTGNSVLPQCEATIPSAALLSPSPDYNVRNLGSGLEDWQSPTT